MNSFITWIGGKKQLRETIVSRFPKEGIQKYVKRAVEPSLIFIEKGLTCVSPFFYLVPFAHQWLF